MTYLEPKLGTYLFVYILKLKTTEVRYDIVKLLAVERSTILFLSIFGVLLTDVLLAEGYLLYKKGLLIIFWRGCY